MARKYKRVRQSPTNKNFLHCISATKIFPKLTQIRLRKIYSDLVVESLIWLVKLANCPTVVFKSHANCSDCFHFDRFNCNKKSEGFASCENETVLPKVPVYKKIKQPNMALNFFRALNDFKSSGHSR